jgi:hypothetical protein
LINVPFGEFGAPRQPQDRRLTQSFRELGDMVFDVGPMAFPSRNIGGQFVGKVSVASLLPKLDAGAPYNRWIFGGGLWLYSEKIVEKIPMGFNPRKASQKWMKIAMWQIEFGLR